MADQAVTLATATSASRGSKIERLSSEQARQTGFTHRFRIPYDVINTSTWTTQGDTCTVTLGATPTKFIVTHAAVSIPTAFAGPAGAFTIQVGTDGDPNNFVVATTAKTAATLCPAIGAAPVTLAGSFAAASDVLTATFTTTASSGALSDITAGVAEVLLGIVDLDDLI